MYKEKYLKALSSTHFLELKADRIEKTGGCCEICKEKDDNLKMHHLSYENVGNESNAELLLVCDVCHVFTHQEYDKQRFVALVKIDNLEEWIYSSDIRKISKKFGKNNILKITRLDKFKGPDFVKNVLLEPYSLEYHRGEIPVKEIKVKAIGSKRAWGLLSRNDKFNLCEQYKITENQLYSEFCVAFDPKVVKAIAKILKKPIYSQLKRKQLPKRSQKIKWMS